MEQLATQTYCQRAALELAALIKHQRKPRGRVRRDSMLLRTCVTHALSALSDIKDILRKGPWTVGERPLKRKGRGGLPFIPIILVTTKDQDTDKVWGLRQGAKAYVVKPIKEEELVAALKEHLPG